MIAYLARATACFPEIDYCHDGVGWVIVGCGVCDVCGVGAAYGGRVASTVCCVRLTFCSWDLVEEVEDEMKRDALKLRCVEIIMGLPALDRTHPYITSPSYSPPTLHFLISTAPKEPRILFATNHQISISRLKAQSTLASRSVFSLPPIILGSQETQKIYLGPHG
jgi:hypothetical protein